ncbi:hypothetical protein ACLMJK_007373 [Lecanora helva]
MLSTLRRGPASAAKSFSPIALCSQCSRLIRPRSTRQPLSKPTYPLLFQSFVTSSQWKRSALATASAEEEDAIEGELEQEAHAEQPPSDAQINQATKHGPITKFKELAEQGLVCQTVVDTLTQDMRLETMTQVQSLTLNESLKGTDILAQARTGTGKTLAFLIPLLQNIINVDPKLEKRSGLGKHASSEDIRAIIISPTRELAEQIAVEAKKVTRNTKVIVQTAVGGSLKQEGLRRIKNQGCHILVGTPGRLNDIFSDRYNHIQAPKLSAFVLDEADRLLDQGFAPEIQAIQDLLPNRNDVDRQTLLYSATVPREVMQMVRRTLKPDFKFVRTVQEGEQQTHEKVPQRLVNVGGFENLMPALVELCKREISAGNGTTNPQARPFKAIVYFAATADVKLAAAILKNLRNSGQSIFHEHPLHPAKIIEMHAQLSQFQRTRSADLFRGAQSGIMLSSDVTARGMDFPNVTHVIQLGLPPSQEQYVHRIGRTARGDKTGEGWLLITDFERREIRQKLHDMPLQPDNTLETAKVDMRKDAQLPEHTAKTLTQVQDATKSVPRPMKAAAYKAALGVYQWIPKKQILLDAMNDRATYGWGMEQPPMVPRGLAVKLGIHRLSGINIGYEEDDERGDRGTRPSFGDRGRGGGSFPSYNRGDRGGYGRSSYGDRGGYGRSSYGRGRDWNRGDYSSRGGGDGFGRRDGDRESPYGRG